MLAGKRSIALDVARATESFDRVLELLPEGHPDRASALFWKATAAQDAGRYEEAEELYRRSIEAFREGGDRIGEGKSLNRLSNVLWDRGAYAEASTTWSDPRRSSPRSQVPSWPRATRPPRRLGSWWVRSTRRSS